MPHLEPAVAAAAALTNLALNRPAMQSSTSTWSRWPEPERDASGANNGSISGQAGFHTALEARPWWQVDLQCDGLIQHIEIINRQHYAQRLRHFTILGSLDGRDWRVLHRKTTPTVFGATDLVPYVAAFPHGELARFVRVQLEGRDCLHFDECRVLGTVATPAEAATRRLALEQAALRRQFLPPGRSGKIVALDGFAIFADQGNYAAGIVAALADGHYEARERELTAQVLRPGDRVLEAGTAIGIIAMVAAAVVGPEAVLTYEANAAVAADARANFTRNGLEGIQSKVGVLTNRGQWARDPGPANFGISRDFWASRLGADLTEADIVQVVPVPRVCLEDELARHRANVLLLDIEGGEAALLQAADLSGVRLIMMETHYARAGRPAIDALMRSLILQGFDLDLARSGRELVVLDRSQP